MFLNIDVACRRRRHAGSFQPSHGAWNEGSRSGDLQRFEAPCAGSNDAPMSQVSTAQNKGMIQNVVGSGGRGNAKFQAAGLAMERMRWRDSIGGFLRASGLNL